MDAEMKTGKMISNAVLTLLFIIIAIIIFAIVILKVSFYRIVGHSMNPTLMAEDIVLSIPRKTYQRGDIIAFELDGATTIKRVIGTPGDKVYIRPDGTVLVNDEVIEENYVLSKDPGNIEVVNPYQVIEGEYFVLGDNRADSKDSRLLHVSGIKEDNIHGKVYFVINKFKRIK